MIIPTTLQVKAHFRELLAQKGISADRARELMPEYQGFRAMLEGDSSPTITNACYAAMILTRLEDK